MANLKPTKARAVDHPLANSPVGREKLPTRQKDNYYIGIIVTLAIEEYVWSIISMLN